MITSTDKVAIVGPILLDDTYSEATIRKVETILSSYGCEVFSPIRYEVGKDYGFYIDQSFIDVAMCTVVILLDGWEVSNAASNIKMAALRQHKPIISQYQLEAVFNGWKV